MSLQRNACGLFALALEVYRRRVEVIYSVLYGIVNKPVCGFLVDDVSVVLILDHRPSHASVSEDTDLVSVARVDPVCHFLYC